MYDSHTLECICLSDFFLATVQILMCWCVCGAGSSCRCPPSYPSLLLTVFTAAGLLLLTLSWLAIEKCVSIETLTNISFRLQSCDMQIQIDMSLHVGKQHRKCFSVVVAVCVISPSHIILLYFWLTNFSDNCCQSKLQCQLYKWVILRWTSINVSSLAATNWHLFEWVNSQVSHKICYITQSGKN